MLQPGGQRGISQQVCYELVSVKTLVLIRELPIPSGCKEEISMTSNYKHRTFITTRARNLVNRGALLVSGKISRTNCCNNND